MAGVPELTAWHRWVSWSLLVLYGGVCLTGTLLLFSFPATTRTSLVNAHLLTSVWAAVPTTWHAWHYGRRTSHLVPRLRPQVQIRRVSVGLTLLLAPAVLVGANPRALSPLTQLGGGSRWIDDGLSRVFVDRLAVSPDGHLLLAGGRGIWVRNSSSQTWRQVGPPDALVLGLTVAPSGAIYVGTLTGLLVSAQPDGPYAALPFPSREVHGIALDPRGRIIWATSRAGVLRSIDGGATWSSQVAGIQSPQTSWAIAYFDGTVYASDAGGVYRWDGESWRPTSGQADVVSLDVDISKTLLFASSMGEGVRTLNAGGRWRGADAGLVAHGAGGAIHVTSVTPGQKNRAYASMMLGGVATSLDGGQSWGAIPAAVPRGGSWRAIQKGSQLFLATGSGVLRYDLPTAATAGLRWWIVMIALIMVAGGVGLRVAALEPRPKRRPLHRDAPPIA